MDKTHAEIARIFHVRPGPLPIVTGRRYGRREMLPTLCAALGHKRGAEVGVREGKFAELFCKAIPDLEMHCIDPWMPVPNYAPIRQERNFAECQRRLSAYPGVVIHRKTSMDALSDIADRSLDFIHIDGRHEFDFVMEDVLYWSRKVRRGGIIALHDYHLTGVKHCCDAYTVAHHIDPWYILKDDQPTAFWVNP